MRPGVKTTEFWIALAVAVLGGLSAMYSEREWAQVAGIVSAALVSLGYGVSRAKSKSNPGPAPFPPQVPAP